MNTQLHCLFFKSPQQQEQSEANANERESTYFDYAAASRDNANLRDAKVSLGERRRL